jgi:phenylalanyl-tRNA synthetase beta chain
MRIYSQVPALWKRACIVVEAENLAFSMRVSLNWIKRILNVRELPLPVEELQNRLTLQTAEIEAIERIGPNLDGVVVGKVLTCAQHPNADRLRVTTVDIGRGAPVQIVCGAANVEVGQSVAVATIGATLTMTGADGKAKSLTIKPVQLRGESSEGMICAEDELGLGARHDGILVLTGSHAPGTPLASVLGSGDSIFIIDNHGLTHRPDLWGHWGWAREIAAVLDIAPPKELDTTWQHPASSWQVGIADDGCMTYAGAVVENVNNRPSPQWLQDALNAVGVRPLGLLVDITNYVMFEIGEPMHAFDRRDIAGKSIIVRGANDGEKFRTLDGKEHQLAKSDLVIADEKRALALAGIMGGDLSKVRDDTNEIILEAAVFKAERIRRTRIRTGTASDSAARFEKSLYPEMASAAIHRAVQLLAELCPGSRATGYFSSGALSSPPRQVPFAPAQADRLIGIDVPGGTQLRLLTRLGFHVQDSQVGVPWWRHKDVSQTVDVIEEIARLHGFHHIKPEVPRLPAAAPAINPLREAEHRARTALSAQGWDEVCTYGFTSDAWAQLLEWDPKSLLRLRHPMSSEQTVLRLHLIPTLAEAVGRNRKHLTEVAIYEIGKRYGLGIGLKTGLKATPDESVVVTGMFAAQGQQSPYFQARDAALALLRGLGYQAHYQPSASPPPQSVPGRIVDLTVDGLVVGLAGELPLAIRKAADCPERVGCFVIELEALIAAKGLSKPVAFSTPSRFQAVDRDFNWVCPEPLPYRDLEIPMRRASGDLCAGVELVTIYRGDQLPPGQKAMTLRVMLQAPDRTLEERELTSICEKIKASVEKQTPARLRQ